MLRLKEKKSQEDRYVPLQDSSMISYLNFLLSIDASEESLKFLTRKLSSFKAGKDDYRTAVMHLAMGRFYLLSFDYKKSVDCCVKSLGAFKQYKDINGLILSKISLSQAYNYLSDSAQVGRMNMLLHEMLFQTDDPIAKAYIRLNLAEHAIFNMAEHGIIVGKIEYTQKDIKEIRDISGEGKCWFLCCIANILLGYLSLEERNTNRAIFYLNSARRLMENYNLPAMFTNYTYHLLPEAYWLEYKIHAGGWSLSRKKASIHRIRRLCQLALKQTESCLFHHGSALRVNAKYLLLEQRIEEAEAFFLKSIDYCSKFGRKFELGLAYYFYAFLLKTSGRKEEARLRLLTAHKLFTEVGASVYLDRISAILGPKRICSAYGATTDQSRTITAILNISRKLSTVKELDLLAGKALQHALRLTDADSGSLFIQNEKRILELKAVEGITPAAAKRKITANRSPSALYHPLELYVPVKVGNQEIGLCYLKKPKTAKEFNGHDTGSIYLFMSQVAPLLENCRLAAIVNREKKANHCSITHSTEKKLRAAVKYIESNYNSTISRNELAKKLDINADNLGRFFKQYTGCRISEYTNRLRMKEAARRLRETDEKVIDIAFAVGFESLTTFNRVFSSILETTPSKYRKRNHLNFNKNFSRLNSLGALQSGAKSKKDKVFSLDEYL